MEDNSSIDWGEDGFACNLDLVHVPMKPATFMAQFLTGYRPVPFCSPGVETPTINYSEL